MQNPNSQIDTKEYVENTDKIWTTKYNHQKRPDPQSRTKYVIPRDRLVARRGRQFTTDTSIANLNSQLAIQEETKKSNNSEFKTTTQKPAPKTKYMYKE